jgi:hypothetical protein
VSVSQLASFFRPVPTAQSCWPGGCWFAQQLDGLPDTMIAELTVWNEVMKYGSWIWLAIGPDLSIAAIREDRVLDEAHATSGDVRRLADLLGLSIRAGTRYTATLNHPDLTLGSTRERSTAHPPRR